jgi:hypothetical protein
VPCSSFSPSSGEAIGAEEEHLLTGLAHAAPTAYEHLHAVERDDENALLRAQIAALRPAETGT